MVDPSGREGLFTNIGGWFQGLFDHAVEDRFVNNNTPADASVNSSGKLGALAVGRAAGAYVDAHIDETVIGIAAGGAGEVVGFVVEVAAAIIRGEGRVAASALTQEMVTVGRVMSKAELKVMQETGKVMESYSGTTHVSMPPSPGTYRAGNPGSIYTEFSVPASSVQQTSTGVAKILGPSSLEGRLAARKGLDVPQMPFFENLKVFF